MTKRGGKNIAAMAVQRWPAGFTWRKALDNAGSDAMKNLITVLCLFLLAACSGVDSDNFATSELTTSIAVTGSDDSTRIDASFFVGSGFQSRAVRLSAGDTMTATMDGEQIELTRSGRDYTGEFDFYREGAEVVIALSRQNAVDATDSTVTLPPLLAITAPSANAVFSADESVTIVWTPAEPTAEQSIFFSLECLEGNAVNQYVSNIVTPDNGSATVTVSDIRRGKNISPPADAVCTAQISMSRSGTGTIDPGLSGSISASNDATVSVRLIP